MVRHQAHPLSFAGRPQLLQRRANRGQRRPQRGQVHLRTLPQQTSRQRLHRPQSRLDLSGRHPAGVAHFAAQCLQRLPGIRGPLAHVQGRQGGQACRMRIHRLGHHPAGAPQRQPHAPNIQRGGRQRGNGHRAHKLGHGHCLLPHRLGQRAQRGQRRLQPFGRRLAQGRRLLPDLLERLPHHGGGLPDGPPQRRFRFNERLYRAGNPPAGVQDGLRRRAVANIGNDLANGRAHRIHRLAQGVHHRPQFGGDGGREGAGGGRGLLVEVGQRLAHAAGGAAHHLGRLGNGAVGGPAGGLRRAFHRGHGIAHGRANGLHGGRTADGLHQPGQSLAHKARCGAHHLAHRPEGGGQGAGGVGLPQGGANDAAGGQHRIPDNRQFPGRGQSHTRQATQRHMHRQARTR